MESVKINTDSLKAEISARFATGRTLLGKSVQGLASELARLGVMKDSPQSIRDYEGGKSIPGGAVLAGLCALGIDANWVLTGKGSPLVGAAGPGGVFAAEGAGSGYAAPARINVKALAAIIEGIAKAQPGAAPSRMAMLAAEFYTKALDEGYITSDGVGEGPAGKSA